MTSLKDRYSIEEDRKQGDLDPKTAIAGQATRTRDYKGYTLERRNPFGFWFVVGRDDLGTFTTQEAAHACIDDLEKKGSA